MVLHCLCWFVVLVVPLLIGWLVLCVSELFSLLLLNVMRFHYCVWFHWASWGCLGGILGAIGGFLRLLTGSWEFVKRRQHTKRQIYTQLCETSVTQYIIASLVLYRGILIWFLGVAGTVDGPWWFLLAASRFLLGRNLAAKRVQGRC
jgi:hypothetical protein